jgi:hypothetical protein
MTDRGTRIFMAPPLLFAGLVPSIVNTQQISEPLKVVQLTGLTGMKENAKGTLTVEKGALHFAYAKGGSDISAGAIEDVTTGADSQAAVGKTVSTVSMAAPYAGGPSRNKTRRVGTAFYSPGYGQRGVLPQGSYEPNATRQVSGARRQHP